MCYILIYIFTDPVTSVSSPQKTTTVTEEVAPSPSSSKALSNPPQQPTATSGGQTFLDFSRKSFTSSSNGGSPPTFLNFRRPYNPLLPRIQDPPVLPSLPDPGQTPTNQQSTELPLKDQQTNQVPQNPPTAEAAVNEEPLTPPINEPHMPPTDVLLTKHTPTISTSQSHLNTATNSDTTQNKLTPRHTTDVDVSK